MLINEAASVDAAPPAKKFSANGTYALGWTLEYDGYQESQIGWGNGIGGDMEVTVATASDHYIEFDIQVGWATLNKRVTALNVYLAQVVNGARGPFYHIRRVAFTDLTTAEAAQWAWTAGAIFDKFIVDGSTDANTLAQITQNDWDSRGADLLPENRKA